MPLFRSRRAPALLLTLGLVLACNAVTGIVRERRLGIVRYHEDPSTGVVVQAPDTVAAGSDFEVSIRTYGGGCIEQGDTEAAVAGMNAEVRPYDLFVTQMPSGRGCPDILRYHVHRGRLRFGQAGEATVTFYGRDHPGDSTITVQRSVFVR